MIGAFLTFASLAIAAAPAADGQGLVLLDLHSESCGPCRQMRPEIAALLEKGYPVKSVQVDKDEDVAARYDVHAVPVLLAVGPDGEEVARMVGYHPAGQVATWFKRVRDDWRDDQAPPRKGALDEEGPPATSSDGAPVPRPWETVVRIKVNGQGAIGFGSGTVIYSTDRESYILTCAHIFKIEGASRQPGPKRYPLPVTVDLFDGKLTGLAPAQVHKTETLKAEVLDYDFAKDVGLIKVRPGRRLPASPVVPADWRAAQRMKMITVGCSLGNDATAWDTVVTGRLRAGSLVENPTYEGTECAIAPKQGRSGGGLYTWDGYLAGVCDFAEPKGDVGLYADPRSIHRLLDRNQLQLAYAPRPAADGPVLADARPAPARAPSRPRREITIPDPGALGVRSPALVARDEPAAPWRTATRDTARPVDRPKAYATEIEVDASAGIDDVAADLAPRPAKPPRPSANDGWVVANQSWPENH